MRKMRKKLSTRTDYETWWKTSALQGVSFGSHSCTAGYIHHCMGALKQHWSVRHKEKCNRFRGTEGWWDITKIVGTEKQILFLAEKLQCRKRNQHQHIWKRENTCAEVTAPLLWQSEVKHTFPCPLMTIPLFLTVPRAPRSSLGKESATARNERHWENLWTIYLEKILLTFTPG